jgi:hypothetical protein
MTKAIRMSVKECPFKVGDKVKEYRGVTYVVTAVESFNTFRLPGEGATVAMSIQRIFKDGRRGSTDTIFGEDIFAFEKVGEVTN